MMATPTRIQGNETADAVNDDDGFEEAVVTKFESLMGVDLPGEPARLQAWQKILKHRAWLIERIKEWRRYGHTRLADAYREHVRKLDLAINSDAPEKKILVAFSVEKYAKAALIEHWRDRKDESKRRDVEDLLGQVAGRHVDLEQEERIDHEERNERRNTLDRRAARIVKRLKP